MNRISRALLLATIPLALVACNPSNADTNRPGQAVAQQDTIPALQAPALDIARKFAHGFDTGNLMSPRQVFVFFDSQCPHCGEFWQESKKLAKDARFTWVPVGVLNDFSTNQGLAILKAAKPVDTMNDHESKLAAHLGGMQAPDASTDPKGKAIIDQNTRLVESFGATGVPFILGVNAKDGTVYTNSGGMPAEQLAAHLGWAPATPATASAAK
jgi:thiol:disulfide interchange protein DsbG